MQHYSSFNLSRQTKASYRVCIGRGAGEMKGISLEENRKNFAALKEIMSRDKNRVCADCLGGSQPTWASINCGVFICMKCAGIHRGLGVHISKVQSLVHHVTFYPL